MTTGPSALDELLRQPERVAILSDFDGTLVEFAPEPHLVEIPRRLIDILGALQGRLEGALALVSGRTLPELDDFLKPLEFPAAGNHGRDVRFANGEMQTSGIPDISAEMAAIEVFGLKHPEVLIERKQGSVALHYRKAPHHEGAVRRLLEDMAAKRDDLTTMDNKMLVELKDAASNKGKAVRALMASKPFAGRVPVFLGDDRNDEDGFIGAQELGGVGIKIGPGDTNAKTRIADVTASHDLLAALAHA